MYFGVVKKMSFGELSVSTWGGNSLLSYTYTKGGHLAIRVKSEKGLYSMRKVYFSDLTLAILFRLDGVEGTFCLVYLRVCVFFSSRNTFVEALTLVLRSEESRISTVADWHSNISTNQISPASLGIVAKWAQHEIH